MRNCAPKASALVLGAAQDSGIVFAPARRGGQRKYVQENLGESRPDATAEAGRLSSGREAAALNEIWTVDFKGWWRNGDKRCEPLTVRDEYSRYLLEVRAVEDARSETVRKRFEQIFERHGLPAAITARPLPVGKECLA